MTETLARFAAIRGGFAHCGGDSVATPRDRRRAGCGAIHGLTRGAVTLVRFAAIRGAETTSNVESL
jgi:hypothetical protein